MLVLEYHDREPAQHPLWFCVSCLLRQGPRRPDAVWDGETWRTEDPETAWREAWCKTRGIDAETGRSQWQRIEEFRAANGESPTWLRVIWQATIG